MVNKNSMAWGSPYFLHPFWNNVNLDEYKLEGFHYLKYESQTKDVIKKEISKLHANQKNCVVENKDIIVGNGATQILSALLYILKGDVYAKVPCFSRFKPLSERNGKKFTSNQQDKTSIQIITTPNNPDGSLKTNEEDGRKYIYDLSYNWKHYTNNVKNYDKDISVFSLSKATGHSSSRIGWGIFKDHNLSKEIERFIELDSSGVSVDSQEVLLKVLKHQETNNYTCFDYGKLILDYRWKLISKLSLPFQVLNGNGMFLWCKGTPPSKFTYIKGEEFGVSNDYFRLNLGCDNNTFSEFYNEYHT